MPKTSVYLPPDLSAYVSTSGLNLSGLLQDAIRTHQAEHDTLEAKFREELQKYRNSPHRQEEWDSFKEGSDRLPFVQCATCGTAVDDAEGCLALEDPYNAAPVALLAHYPEEMRRSNLRYWADSGFRDVALGMPG